MRTSYHDLIAFWGTPWSKTLRDANVRACLMGQPITLSLPDKAAPRWVRPLCVQRWVGQAVAARLAAHPHHLVYRFGNESEPALTDSVWATYDSRCLRASDEDTILWMFGVEVERLLRLAQEPPKLVGDGDWTRAALGISEHIAQLYAELRRRYKATRARAIVRAELARCVDWDRADVAADTVSADQPDASVLPATFQSSLPSLALSAALLSKVEA